MVTAAVDVVASVAPSAAGPPPSVAVAPTCVCVGTAAACARGLSYVSAPGQGRVLSPPARALTAPAEGRPAQANACERVASARWAESGETARSSELD